MIETQIFSSAEKSRKSFFLPKRNLVFPGEWKQVRENDAGDFSEKNV